MTFFYNLNKTLDAIRDKPEVTHSQLNERDMGKHNNATTGFKALAKKAGAEYGSKAAGERVAGAQFQKMKKAGQLEEQDMDESAFLAAIGKKKYGDEGMKALQKAGRDNASDSTMDNIRDKYDKYDEGAHQGGPDKSQIPAVQRPGNPVTLKDLEKERTQSPTTPEGMRALQNKLNKIQSLDEKMSDNQASDFAALAPPKDKITFADKIAGAKKEVDEMLGDVAAEAMKNALGSGKKVMADEGNEFTDARLSAIKSGKPSFRLGGKSYKVTGNTSDERGMDEGEDNAFTAHKRPRGETPKVGTITHGSKHDVEEIPGGRRVTRRTDAQGFSVGADDGQSSSDAPRGRGRPKGPAKAPERVTGGATKHKGGRKMTKEGDVEITDQGEYDQEGDMAKDSIKTVVRHAQALEKILGDNDNLPEWVQSKLAKIESMMTAVDDYMQNQESDQDDEMAMGEEKTSTRDRRAEQAGKKVTKDIEYDEKKKDGIHGSRRGAEDSKAEKSGKKVAKDIEHDEKVDENTVAGSVATSSGPARDPGASKKAKASSGSMQVGKGVYEGAIAESFNRKLNTVLTEGISINASQGEDGKKTLTVTASDEDAVNLAQILNLAGLPKQEQQVCSGCGSTECGCNEIDEADYSNSPDVEVTSSDYMVNGLSGGLNGRKSTGQTTIPVLNTDERRQTSEAAESRLWSLYKDYANK